MERTLERSDAVPLWVWISIALVLVAHTLIYGNPRRPQAKSDYGWKVLRPTSGFYLFGWAAAIVGLLFTYLLVMSVGYLAHWKRFSREFDDQRLAVAIALASPFVVVLAFHAFVYIFLGRFRYNEKGLLRDFPVGRGFHEWSQITHMDRRWIMGPRFWLKSGRSFVVWEMYNGYNELIRYAGGRGLTLRR